MTTLTVTADVEALVAGDVVPVVASLPLSLAPAPTGGPADLVAVDGGPGWSRRLTDALGPGSRGVLVVHPTAAAPVTVPEAAPVPVVVDYRFAGNPALVAAAAAYDSWPPGALLEVAAVVADAATLAETLVDQAATLRRLGHPVERIERLTWSDAGYYVQGSTAAGDPVLLSAHVTTGAAPGLRVRGLAATRVVELDLPDPRTAAPALLVSTAPRGATTAPTLWETSHRAAWRRLHAAVLGGYPTDDLTDLRTDLTVVAPALPA